MSLTSGSGINNHSHVGFINDGKLKLLILRDENGQVYGNCVMRLLLDDNNKPALFIDVPRIVDRGKGDIKRLTEAFKQMAIFKSNQMGVNLYSANNYYESSKSSQNRLYSHWSPPPQFEYSNTLGGTKGIYSFYPQLLHKQKHS